MELKICYENTYQTVVLDEEATRGHWVNLLLGTEDDQSMSQEERERRIQQNFDAQFNKPEYNVWHRETRHISQIPKCKNLNGKRGFIKSKPEDAENIDGMDYAAIAPDVSESVIDKIEYEEVCSWIRRVLAKKPEWADAFIAVRIDREPIREYAARMGVDENSITQKLKRATKKLRENYSDRQI